MESKSPESDKYFAKIKDVDRLKDLKRRPRCSDGSLDLRAKVNKCLSKDGQVTDYYDPDDPKDNVPQNVIKHLLEQQREEYDKLRFKELAAQKARLEKKEQLRKEQ